MSHMWIVQMFLLVYSEIVQCLVLHLALQLLVTVEWCRNN